MTALTRVHALVLKAMEYQPAPGEVPFTARPKHLACCECRRTPLCGFLDGEVFLCAWCHDSLEPYSCDGQALPRYMTPRGCVLPSGEPRKKRPVGKPKGFVFVRRSTPR